MGLIGSGILSGLGSFFGGKSAAKAQADANAQNLALQRETNAQNRAMYDESRGSMGSAILPMYLKDYEAGLSRDAASTAQALFRYGGGPEQRLADSEEMLRRYNPAIEAGDQSVIDLATGKTAMGRTSSLAPVLAARTGLARSRASEINTSLDQILAGLRSTRAAGGFRGGSTFDTNRAMAATVGARQAAATGIGQAELENAMAGDNLYNSNLQMQLVGLQLPFQRAQQQMQFNDLPATSAAAYYQQALSPLSFFRMNPGTMPYAQAPQMGAVPNTGQLAGAALSGTAQSIGQYLAQQQLMQQLQGFYQQGAGSGMPSAESLRFMPQASSLRFGPGP